MDSVCRLENELEVGERSQGGQKEAKKEAVSVIEVIEFDTKGA